jgi:hypothetical protein
LTSRNVNKHRQVLAAMFSYGCRSDGFNLPANPVSETDKRREEPPAALDYCEVEEVEALARCCERGDQRTKRVRTRQPDWPAQRFSTVSSSREIRAARANAFR